MAHRPFPSLGRVVACAALAALGAGCTNNPYPPGESNGSVQYLNFGDDLKSLDPTFSFTTTESALLDTVCPSYYRYHYLKQTPLRLELQLGAKEPVRRALPGGGEEWTFTIRRDLRFPDDPCFPGGKGRGVVARDFVYSFQRMADPKGEFPLAGVLESNVAGWREYAAGFARERTGFADPNYDRTFPAVSVDPHDPYTFRVRLVRPYPQLRFLMAMHCTTPQAREAVEHYGDEYRRHPVGCGGYRLAEYVPKQRLVLRRNPTGHAGSYPTEGDPGDQEAGLLAPAGEPLPRTDTIVYSMIKETTSAWNLFLQGYLDETSLNSNNFSQVMGSGGSLSPRMRAMDIRLQRAPQTAVYYLAFNLRDPVFGGYAPERRKLRQAISLAVDSREFIDLALQGNGTPAQWMLPAGIFGHDPNYRNPYRTVDIARAKVLLAEAGYPDGKDAQTGERLVLHLDTSFTTATGRTYFGLLRNQIERIGIRVEHRATNGNQFQDKVHRRRHQCIFYGWFADYPDPENFVFLLAGENAVSGPNYAFHENAEYDRLFDQVRAMDDSPERKRLLDAMRAIAVEECAWVPLYHPVTVSLNHAWVDGEKPNPLANDGLLYRGVDHRLRAARIEEWNRPVVLPLALAGAGAMLAAIPAVRVVRRRANRRLRVAEEES